MVEVKIDTVNGNLITGDVTLVERPRSEREFSWWDLSTAELQRHLEAARAEWWGAWRKYWFNVPCLLVVLCCCGLLLVSWNIISNFQAVRGAPTLIWWAISFGLVMLPVFYWLDKIRRVESRVAAHARADIDEIELVLRRRKKIL